MGSSLKGRSKDEWEVALDNLRDSEAYNDHEEGVRAAISCLKLSYDYLESNEVKQLFFMCSMFPEDYEISIEDLIRYAIGLGLGGRSSLKSTRSWIKAGINKLLDSYLLMHSNESEKYVKKIHDMAREGALWIAKRFENHKILVNVDKPFSTLVEDDSTRDCFVISSWYQQNQILCQLHAPNLKVLLLNTQENENLLLETCEGIQGLKVLSVMKTKYYSVQPSSQLPPSIQLLKNLGTLRLNGLELGDISFIATLTTLEILDLQSCSFNELPDKLGNLKRLKLLDLLFCGIAEKNYNGAIGKCSQLEELYLSESDKHVCQIVLDIGTLPKLHRFKIRARFTNIPHHVERTRVLEIRGFNISKLRASKKNILQIAEIVDLSDLLGGCKNIIPDMIRVVGGMNDLATLCLTDCEEIEYIFDTTSDSEVVDALIAKKLVHLRLSQLDNLKELCRGSPMKILPFFEKLKELEISYCLQLYTIFPQECNLTNLKILRIVHVSLSEVLFFTSVAQSLQQLEVLSIERCHELKQIIANGREIVPAPRNSHLLMPRLKKLKIHDCPELESIFPICYVEGLARLQELQISWASKLKYVFGECDHNHKDHPSHQYHNHTMLPHLEILSLRNLENLIAICPENYCTKWPSPRELTVRDCPKLAPSWIGMMVGSNKRHPHLNENLPSTLQQLVLEGLPQLSLISWVGSSSTPGQILSLQCIQNLRVGGCENLKSMFSMEVHTSLPELVSLHIYDCQELEQIIATSKELVQPPNVQVYFPKLTDITVDNCNKLKSLFPVTMVRMLPQLSTLYISEATQLEEVFRHGNGDDIINEMEIVLPKLTKIVLYKLPSFVDLYRGCKLHAVKLEELHIEECTKIAPSLRPIQ